MNNLVELADEIRQFINCYGYPVDYRVDIEDGTIIVTPVDTFEAVPEMAQNVKEWLIFNGEPVEIEENGDQIIIYPLAGGEQ
jgi:hypothetical protein